jgi:DNA-binding response OmpR family regulator
MFSNWLPFVEAVGRSALQSDEGKTDNAGIRLTSGTILIVEDDRTFRASVVRYLQRLQFMVFEATEIEQALQCLEQHPVELVILDIGLGKKAALKGMGKTDGQSGSSGYALLEIVRSRPGYISIIVLTSLEEPIYEIAALQRGADDFLLKHVELEALAARVQCCLRRGRLLSAASSEQAVGQRDLGTNGGSATSSAFQAGDFHIDSEHRLLRIGQGAYVHLTDPEVRLLRLMARNSGRVYRKHELLEALWGRDAKQSYHAIDALVKSIRRKIEPQVGKPYYLRNAYGVGYRLNLVAKTDK